MANISAAFTKSIEILSPWDYVYEFPVVSGDTIYQGSGVQIASNGLLTYATKASATATLGRAEQTVVGDGVKTCRVRAGIMLFLNNGTNPMAVADRLKPCYWLNANEIDSQKDTNPFAGLVWDVTSDGVYVLMGPTIKADLT